MHPFIEHLKQFKNINVALENLNSNISYKKHGSLLIFKYNSKFGSILERSCRGLIYDYVNDKIVCYSNTGTCDFQTFTNEVDISNCVIEENLEGSLINLYFYNGRWNVSTKFDINADEVKFRTKKTYRQIFDSLFNIDYNILDKKYTYSFLIRVPLNRLVTNIRKRELFHIETQNNITGEKIFMDIGIKHPLKINAQYKSYNKLYKVLTNLDWENKGYMLYSRDRSYRCSLINPEYKKIYDLVTTHKDLKYIMLETALYTYKTDMILDYFPEYNTIMKKVINDVKLLQQKLYSFYVEIFSKKTKKITDIDKKYIKILQETYTLYNNKRKHNILFEIYSEDIYDLLIKKSCDKLYEMLYM